MRVLGIDPSSSCCGVAVVEDGNLLVVDAWHRPTHGSAPEKLWIYYSWLRSYVAISKIDMACVEYLSVERNALATRLVSHYQAASVLACKEYGIVVVEARVTSARKAALGAGNIPKDLCFDRIRKMFPNIDFGTKGKTNGSMDKSDATVLALAGPTLAEM